MNPQHPTSTKQGTSRRAVVRSAAWSLPVIAVAVAAPGAAASTPPDPKTPVTCGNRASGDNGTYTVDDSRVIVSYVTAPDIYEINVHFVDGSSASYGTNYNTAPAAGSLQWAIETGKTIAWVQVHTFNTHYQDGVCQ